MSKKEGDLLKDYLRSNRHDVTKFARDMGFTERQGLYYHLAKDKLDFEFKEKAAKILDTTIEDIFSHKSKSEKTDKTDDREKEVLRDLVDAQKQIISQQREMLDNWKEIIVAQGLRNEYLVNQVLYNQALILIRVDPAYKGRDPGDVHTELQSAALDKLKKDHSRTPALG